MVSNEKKITDKLVSILMPVFNSSRFIRVAIESVCNQTYKNWELIICDDGSFDNSLEIAQEYSDRDSRISIIQNIYDKGAPGARNSCLDIAAGRYIAFLDADDMWLENKLELQIAFMEVYKYSFVYSYHEIVNEDGNFISDCLAPSSVNLGLMRVSNFIPCLTAIYDSHVLGKVYQPNIVKRNDFALWLKILNSGRINNAYCLKISTARYRSNSYGLSSNKLDAIKYFYRCLHEYADTNRVHAVAMTSIYLIVVMVKKIMPKMYNKIVSIF